MTGGNVKAVCSWIGNSPQVAMKHYAQTTEADMNEAAKMAVLNDGENMVQNTVHPMTKSECNPVQDENQGGDVTPDDFSDLHSFAGECRNKTKDVHWALLDLNQ